MFRFQFAVVCVCVLALAGTVQANTITHNGVLLFSDNFESQIVGNVPDSFSLNPGPGQWEVNGSPADIANVIDNTSTVVGAPGPFEGNQYLHMARGDGKYSGRGIGDNPVDTGQIHAEMMVYQEDPGVFFTHGASAGGEGQNSTTALALDALNDGTLMRNTGSYATLGLLQAAGGGNLTYIEDQWQKWEFDIDLDADTYVVSIDGVPSEVTPLNTGLTLDDGSGTPIDPSIRWIGARMSGTNAPSVVYFDAVPEPSTVVLLLISLVGLLVGFGRRSK
jgi:hypothetical protein